MATNPSTITGSVGTPGISERCVARDSGGDIYFVYTNDTQDTIYIRMSGDGGITYQSAVMVHYDIGRDQISPTITISGSTLVVVWLGKTATYPNYYNILESHSTNKGVSWSTPAVVQHHASYDYNAVSVAVDNSGKVHIAASGPGSTNPGYHNIIHMSTSDLTTWSSVHYVTDVAYDNDDPSIIIREGTNLHILWHGKDGTYTRDNIRHAASSNETVWATSWVTTSNTYNYRNVSPLFDTNDLMHVAYVNDDSPYGVYHKSSDTAGVTWSTEHEIKSTSSAPYNVSLCVESDRDYLYCGLTDGDDWYIRKSIDSGSTWSTFTTGGGLSLDYYPKGMYGRYMGGDNIPNIGFYMAIFVSDGDVHSHYYHIFDDDYLSTNIRRVEIEDAAYGQERHGAVARQSDATLYRLYKKIDGGTTTLYIAVSSDSGATWDEKDIVDTSYTILDYTIIVDDDNIYVFFIEDHGHTFIRFTMSDDQGDTWATVEALTGLDERVSGLSAILDDLGTIHIFFGYEDDTYPNSLNLAYMYSDDQGDNFSSISWITTNNTTGTDVQVVFATMGVGAKYIHVIYQLLDAGDTNVNYVQSQNHGSTWETPIALTTDLTYAQYISCPPIAEYDGTITVYYYGKSATYTNSMNIKVRQSTNNGTSFGAESILTTVNTDGLDHNNVCATISGQGYFYMSTVRTDKNAPYWGHIMLYYSTTGTALSYSGVSEYWDSRYMFQDMLYHNYPTSGITNTKFYSVISYDPDAASYIELFAYYMAPTVSTQAATSVSYHSATGNGTILDTGGQNCTERGFQWGLTQVATWNVYAAGTFGVGAFTNTLSWLEDDTMFYYRAYAKNSAGYGYGEWVDFTTLEEVTPTYETTEELYLENISSTPGENIATLYYINSHFWCAEDAEDITNDLASPLRLELSMGGIHRANITLYNYMHNYTDPTSSYYLDKGSKFVIDFNGKKYKFIAEAVPENIGEGIISVPLLSLISEWSKTIVQLRTQLGASGLYTVEDTLYKAIYESGWFNYYNIVMPDGEPYTPSAVSSYTIPIGESSIVYDGLTLLELLNDITAKGSCIWYENPTDDWTMSNLEIIDAVEEYEYGIGDRLVVDIETNATSGLSVSKSYDSIFNRIALVGGLSRILTDSDSIRSTGFVRLKRLEVPAGADEATVLRYAYKYLSVSKDPDVSISFTLRGLANIDTMDYYIFPVDSVGNRLTYLPEGVSYRLKSVSYDIGAGTTTFEIGNIQKSYLMDDLETLITNEISKETESSNMIINKGANVSFVVHTDKDMIGVFTTVPGTPAAQIDIDYIPEPEETADTIIYMDGDALG